MSLIHEALQKAEAERRTGELPSLLSVNAPLKRTRRSPLPALAIAAALVLLTAAVYSNRELLLDTVGLSNASVDAVTKPSPEQGPAITGETELPQVTHASPAKKPSALREANADGDIDPVDETAAQSQAPAVPAPIPPPEATPETARPDPQPSNVGEIPTPELAPPDAIVTVDAPPPRPAVPDSVTQPDPVAAAIDAAPVLAEPQPYLFELPLATRKELPALKITMHVYSADSSKRFAIIDGKRVNEGGILGNDLNVIEIRRDAILIDFRGTRFLLPRLGL